MIDFQMGNHLQPVSGHYLGFGHATLPHYCHGRECSHPQKSTPTAAIRITLQTQIVIFLGKKENEVQTPRRRPTSLRRHAQVRIPLFAFWSFVIDFSICISIKFLTCLKNKFSSTLKHVRALAASTKKRTLLPVDRGDDGFDEIE